MRIRRHLPVIAVLVVGAILRFASLGQIPVSLTDDEVRLAASAYTIAKTGADVYGHPYPLSFPLDGFSQNPVPVYVTAVSIKLFGPSMWAIRLPAALMGVIGVYLLYLIGNSLWPKTRLGLFAAAALSVNVWHIQLSRFLHEGSFALFFYLLAFTLFLSSSRSCKRYIAGAITLLLAFYSYHATKLLFIPVVLLILCYPKRAQKKHLSMVLGITISIAFGSLFILSHLQHATQYGSPAFFFQNRQAAATTVELERRASNAPPVLQLLYRNKYAYWARTATRNYLYTFSPQYLFLNQEGSGIYSLWFRGQLYLTEAPLLILGWLMLFAKKRSMWLWLTALAALSPLASALGPGDPSYTMRSVLLLLPLMVFIGAGINALFDKTIIPRRWIPVLFVILSVSYIAHLTGYLFQYYDDWSRYGARYYSYDTKLMIDKAYEELSHGNRVIIAPGNDNTLLHWMLYKTRNPYIIQHALQSGNLTDGKLTIKSQCLSFLPKGAVYITQKRCAGTKKPKETLINLDKQTAWYIYR